MNKNYIATTKGIELEFIAPTPRESLNAAMKFAEKCDKRGVAVVITTATGEYVWSNPQAGVAGQTRANVTECIGNVWHVCVNRYANLSQWTEYGLPNPVQTMQSFEHRQAALTFAAFHNADRIDIKPMTGEPFYVTDGKAGRSLD